MQHEFHEFASMFPLMEGEEMDRFIADIKANGQHELIVMLDNKILDGRNRYIACQKLGIKPRMRDFQCIDGDPLAYVWSQNVTRRHLSESQRAMAVAKRVTFVERGNVEHGRIGGLVRQGLVEQAEKELAAISQQADRSLTLDEAAKLANVSVRQIGRAKAILRHGTPEEVASIERGEAKIYKVSENAVKRAAREKSPEFGKNGPNSPTGFNKIQLPEGYTPESLAREGLKLEAQGVEASAVYKKLKVGDDSYRKMREIVIISDMKSLTPRDRKAADFALKTLNETKQHIHAYPAIEHIADRLWGTLRTGRRRTLETAKARLLEFEKQIEIIAHVCETELEVPYLSQQQAVEVLERLNSASKGLKQLTTQIKEFE